LARPTARPVSSTCPLETVFKSAPYPREGAPERYFGDSAA
jgi:hypothetical protein